MSFETPSENIDEAETIDAEIAPEEIETTPEVLAEREPVFEEARNERSSILQRVFSKKIADVTLNLTPGIDVTKLMTEAVIGKTMGGRELSPSERRSYAAVAGMVALAYALHAAGMNYEAAAARLSGTAIGAVTISPEYIKNLAEQASEKFPGAAAMLQKTSASLENIQPFVEEATRGISNYLRNDPDLILLDLRANA